MRRRYDNQLHWGVSRKGVVEKQLPKAWRVVSSPTGNTQWKMPYVHATPAVESLAAPHPLCVMAAFLEWWCWNGASFPSLWMAVRVVRSAPPQQRGKKHLMEEKCGVGQNVTRCCLALFTTHALAPDFTQRRIPKKLQKRKMRVKGAIMSTNIHSYWFVLCGYLMSFIVQSHNDSSSFLPSWCSTHHQIIRWSLCNVNIH